MLRLTKEQKVRLVGIPTLSLVIALTLYDRGPLWTNNFWLCLLDGTFFTFVLWHGNCWIFFRLRRLLPEYRQTRQRLILQATASLLLTMTFAIFMTWVFSLSGVKDFSLLSWARTVYVSLVPSTLMMAIYESVYFFQDWRQNVEKTESLARAGMQSQLEALKNQLDPHFLFNSLNTLAALIDEENEPAQKYLEQLSDVYRYVLMSKDRDTVPLREELDFLEAYVYLNKTRFRENLVVENTIPANYLGYHVAPLSLQMLVENALKHNVVSREKPLRIRLLHTEGDYLVIENNVQAKTVLKKASTKVGLENIINRYGLLTARKIEIIRDELLFTVKLPLLEPALT